MARCVLEEVSQTVVFTRGLNEWRALCRIMYSLSVCSDGPPARTLSSTYPNSTELSKYIWGLKRSSIDYKVEWSTWNKAPAYSPAWKSCPLCLAEKLCIITADKDRTLNRRSELVSTCRRRRKYLLALFANTADPTRAEP